MLNKNILTKALKLDKNDTETQESWNQRNVINFDGQLKIIVLTCKAIW